MAKKKTNSEAAKETSFRGRFLNFFILNSKIIAVAVICLLIGAGGVFAINQNYRQPALNEAITVTPGSPEPVKQAEEPTPGSTTTKNKVPLKTEVAEEPSSNGLANAPVSTPTQVPTQTPACDELRKQVFWDEYKVGLNDATTEARRLSDEVFAKEDYANQEAELNIIEENLFAKTKLLYGQYLINIRSINCSN